MKSTTVDEYIASAPEELKGRLTELRKTIKFVAPDAEERISYGIPYYHYKGRLVYFAYAKKHIGIYAITTSVLEKYKDALKGYVKSKGTIQLPHSEKLPLNLVTKLVKAQMKQNQTEGREKL